MIMIFLSRKEQMRKMKISKSIADSNAQIQCISKETLRSLSRCQQKKIKTFPKIKGLLTSF
jgi:hypothetical protein